MVLLAAARSISGLVSLPQAGARVARSCATSAPPTPALREALSRILRRPLQPRAQRAAQRTLVLPGREPERCRSDADFRALGHLLAAASLHRMHDRGRRDEQMRQLARLTRKSASARPVDEGARLLAAEWAIDDRDAPRAIELLAELPPGVARRTQALRLQPAGATLDAAAARGAADRAPAGQAPGVLARRGHQLAAHAGRRSAGRHSDADALRRVWQQLDAADRRDASVAARAAARAPSLGAPRRRARPGCSPFWDRIGELERDERRAVALALVEALCAASGSEWLPRLESAAALRAARRRDRAAVGAA